MLFKNFVMLGRGVIFICNIKIITMHVNAYRECTKNALKLLTVAIALAYDFHMTSLVRACLTYYTVSQKKPDTKLLPVTSPNVNRFSKFFHRQSQQ